MPASTPIRQPVVPRQPDVIAAEMHRLSDALRATMIEYEAAVVYYAGQPPRPVPAADDRVLSLDRAADAIGWRPKTLRRHILRHNTAHPHDKIAHQPGGMKNAPWRVPMGRLRRYVRDLDG